MVTEIFVQARMGSTRLPGKVLKQVLGKPLLHYLLERLKHVKNASAIRVLTSTEPADDAIAHFCDKFGVSVYRGSKEDVLDRYYQAEQKYRPDAIVRITGDCPLIDPTIVDKVISTFNKEPSHWNYVSNSLQRTFPRGLDTEIFTAAALEKTFREAKNPSEREHVTLYMYRHPEKFNLKNVASATDLSHHRWTVDTQEDFELIKLIIENLYPHNPLFTTQDILNLLQQHPEWVKINSNIAQKET